MAALWPITLASTCTKNHRWPHSSASQRPRARAARSAGVAVIADATGKKAVYSNYLQPKAALVDPRLHHNLPPVLTAITGLDALGHALECTASTKSNAIGDAVARAALTRRLSGIRTSRSPRRSRRTLSNGALCPTRRTAVESHQHWGRPTHSATGSKRSPLSAAHPCHTAPAVALVLPGVMRHNAPGRGRQILLCRGSRRVDARRQEPRGRGRTSRGVDRRIAAAAHPLRLAECGQG